MNLCVRETLAQQMKGRRSTFGLRCMVALVVGIKNVVSQRIHSHDFRSSGTNVDSNVKNVFFHSLS